MRPTMTTEHLERTQALAPLEQEQQEHSLATVFAQVVVGRFTNEDVAQAIQGREDDPVVQELMGQFQKALQGQLESLTETTVKAFLTTLTQLDQPDANPPSYFTAEKPDQSKSYGYFTADKPDQS